MKDPPHRMRLLSNSEANKALTCQAQWDFAYGGHLAGATLKPKTPAVMLIDGKAWGAAVAEFHRNGDIWDAHLALEEAFKAEYRRAAKDGFPVPLWQRVEAMKRLGSILDHYALTADPLDGLVRIEEAVIVPLPGRAGVGRSNRYGFIGYLDGYKNGTGPGYLVENKLRTSLTPLPLLERQRQVRQYAWALRERDGISIQGAIVNERLNESPRPVRLVQGKRKGQGKVPSHAANQITTPDIYVATCREFDVEPDPVTIDALAGRQWQQRVTIVFRPDELDEAGRELVSASKLIAQLDSGALYPVRNAKRSTCGYCEFAAICSNPSDPLAGSLYNRTVPKRLRGPLEV